MFLRRQDVIDQFDASFCETEDGEVLFLPRRAKIGLPITWDEYQGVKAAFERVHTQNMLISWIVTLGAGGYGLYAVISEGSYLTFFGAWAAGLSFNFCLHLRDGLGVLLPLIILRNEFEKSILAEAAMQDSSENP